MPNFEKYNEQHHNQLENELSYLASLYNEFINQVAVLVGAFKVKDVFKFKDIAAKSKFKELFNKFVKKQEDAINVLIDRHWNLADEKNDIFVKNAVKKLGIADDPIYYRRHEALTKFKKRRHRIYSDRVWNYSKQFQQELEMAIDTAIKDGTPVNKLTTEIKKHLREDKKLFRRYRDNNGQLKLSKNALAYNPGQGVYRSSFKNAQRLARTEVNRAYRRAEIERMKLLDFVIGYKVKRSNNPYPCPVCESLKGQYPKDFIFEGWHPNCRCFIDPITTSVEQFANDEKPKLITAAPQFDKWVQDNADRIKRAKSLPYFLRDNRKFWEKHLTGVKDLSKYDSLKWDKTYKSTNGFVVTDKQRLKKSKVSKQETLKLKKEQAMSKIFADNGYEIELWSEKAGISSPDGSINGVPMDLKSLSSHNNVVKYAKKAISKQGAKVVLFEFSKETQEIYDALQELKRKGIKAYFYFAGKDRVLKNF